MILLQILDEFSAEEKANKPIGLPAGPAQREQREREALEAQEQLLFPKEIEASIWQ